MVLKLTMRLAGVMIIVFMVMSIAVGGVNDNGVYDDEHAVGGGNDHGVYGNDHAVGGVMTMAAGIC